MCGFASVGAPATTDDLILQFNNAMQNLREDDQIVKIYTSGSFFDPIEVPEPARLHILDVLKNKNHIEKLVVESRPEYILPEMIEDCASNIPIEVAIGLETANDLIRKHAINKGFTFADFKIASEIVHRCGGRVKAYLLLKPPFLSERAAVSDVIKSADIASKYADILSLNLCNVQRGTDVERMWRLGEYRPPWLWSAVEVLKNITHTVICDPVAAGARRGPHNCGDCDLVVAEAIRAHALSQDSGVFEELSCKCKIAWEKIVELEDYTFGAPLT